MNVLFIGTAAGVGTLIGFVAAYFVLSAWPSLILWGIAGLLLGYFAKGTREVVLVGSVYGFFLSISFLFSSFGASAERFPSFVLLTLALSIIGILAGVISAAIGSFLKRYLVLESFKK